MSLVQFKNNAISTLRNAITAGETTILVQSGDGSKFPGIGAADEARGYWFPLTLIAADGSAMEIVKCTRTAADTFTIERAQEDTSPIPHAAGAIVSHRETAAMIESYLKSHDNTAFIWQGLNVFENTGTANNVEVTIPNVTEYKHNMLVVVQVSDNTGAMTLNVNGLGIKQVRKPNNADCVAGDALATVLAKFRYNSSNGRFYLENPQVVSSSASAAESPFQRNKRDFGDGGHGNFLLTIASGDVITTTLTDGLHYEWTPGTRTLRLLQGFPYEFDHFLLSGVTVLFDMPESIVGAPIYFRCLSRFLVSGGSTITLPKNSQLGEGEVWRSYGGRSNFGEITIPTRGSEAIENETFRTTNGTYRKHASLWGDTVVPAMQALPMEPWQLNGIIGESIFYQTGEILKDDNPPGGNAILANGATPRAGSSVGFWLATPVFQLINNSEIDASGDNGVAGSSNGSSTVFNDGGAGGNGGSVFVFFSDTADYDTASGALIRVGGGLGGAYDDDGKAQDENAIAGPAGGAGIYRAVNVS